MSGPPIPAPSLATRALRYAGRRAVEAGARLRGAAIQSSYSAHYRAARRIYPAQVESAIDAIGVRVVRPDSPDPAIRLPDGFDSLVTTVARGAAAALDRSANCEFYPEVPAEEMAELSGEVPAVSNGEVLTIKLQDPFGIDGLLALCDPLLDQLEQRFYGAYTIVDKLYVYRSPVCRLEPSASWLWHYDNHPREMLKVMVYLTDVNAGTAPFEYLRGRTSRLPLWGSPLAPLYGDSRIATLKMERLLAGEWEREAVTGPRGTVLVFDDNVVHRATAAATAHRDVVVFQVRPVAFAPVSRIHRRWTGTFKHRDLNRNPWEPFPHPRVVRRKPQGERIG